LRLNAVEKNSKERGNGLEELEISYSRGTNWSYTRLQDLSARAAILLFVGFSFSLCCLMYLENVKDNAELALNEQFKRLLVEKLI